MQRGPNLIINWPITVDYKKQIEVDGVPVTLHIVSTPNHFTAMRNNYVRLYDASQTEINFQYFTTIRLYTRR